MSRKTQTYRVLQLHETSDLLGKGVVVVFDKYPEDFVYRILETFPEALGVIPSENEGDSMAIPQDARVVVLGDKVDTSNVIEFDPKKGKKND